MNRRAAWVRRVARPVRRLVPALLLAVLLPGPVPPAAGAPLRAGDPAPAARPADLAGARLEVPAGFAGRIVVLHFWASWCPPCVEEMKALQSLSAELQGLGFQPLSIDVGEEKTVVESWLRPLGITYPVLLDPDSAVARLYGVTGLPMTFILDREGKIRYKILGEINRTGLRRLILTIRDGTR